MGGKLQNMQYNDIKFKGIHCGIFAKSSFDILKSLLCFKARLNPWHGFCYLEWGVQIETLPRTIIFFQVIVEFLRKGALKISNSFLGFLA